MSLEPEKCGRAVNFLRYNDGEAADVSRMENEGTREVDTLICGRRTVNDGAAYGEPQRRR